MGHVLVGIDEFLADFNVLPPYFNLNALLENKSIRRAMDIMYGPICLQWADTPHNPTGLLLRVLASFDCIKTLARTNTDHPFNAILLVFHSNLVDKVKVLVTTEKSSVVSKATGIPPHIEQSIKLQKLLEISTTCLELPRNQAVDIKQVRMRD